MQNAETIDGGKKAIGGQRRGVPKPPRRDGFAGGRITPQQALAARWGKDRRTVVQMAQKARPEAFDVVVSIMRNPTVEPATRLRAGELVLAYADGKPRQSVDVSIGAPRDMSLLSTAELEAIAAGAPAPFALTYEGNVFDGEAQPVEEPAAPAPVVTTPSTHPLAVQAREYRARKKAERLHAAANPSKRKGRST